MRIIYILLFISLCYNAHAQALRAPFLVNFSGGGGSGCTDGESCLCDTLVVSGSTILLCEDWENAGFYEDASNSWRRGSGSPHDRGVDSEWRVKYGNADGNLWTSGSEPFSPYLGNACGYSSGCTGTKEYCSAAQGALTGAGVEDCWGPGTNDGARVDIQRSGDFDAEFGSITLSGGTGATADVGAGNQHLAYRIPAGSTNGNTGGESWTATTDLGLTELVAYSSNVLTTGILAFPWKHDEYGNCPYCESFPIGNTGYDENESTTFPFNSFFFGDIDVPPEQAPCRDEGFTQATCEAELADATKNVGRFKCNTAGLQYGPTPGTGDGEYQQSTDWPAGTWACVRAHVTGMGTTDMEVKIWHNDELIVHLDNFDSLAADICNRNYDEMIWNAYSNANQSGGTPTTAMTYRYQDNIVLTSGPPATCAQIGFDTSP